MKTSQRSNRLKSLFKPEKPVISKNQNANDDLIVICDASNGKYYYLSVVDNFFMDKYEYVVMYNYEPDDGNHKKPELVIMRTSFTDKGEQYFYSIKDRGELNDAFDAFIRRYFESEKQGKQYSKNPVFFTNPNDVDYYSGFDTRN
ncbi:MAG: DUF1292 domain-containing protein [Clostridiales bacterium]|nr:DUF1292 domain-containing protein [Clostridiales bacterium]